MYKFLGVIRCEFTDKDSGELITGWHLIAPIKYPPLSGRKKERGKGEAPIVGMWEILDRKRSIKVMSRIPKGEANCLPNTPPGFPIISTIGGGNGSPFPLTRVVGNSEEFSTTAASPALGVVRQASPRSPGGEPRRGPAGQPPGAQAENPRRGPVGQPQGPRRRTQAGPGQPAPGAQGGEPRQGPVD